MRRLLAIFAALSLLGAGLAAAADPNWEAGVKAFQAQNFAAAVAAFQKYVESGGDNYEGHLMLGQALLKNKQYAPAASHLQRALELKAGDAGTQLALGQALLLGGKKADACRALQGVQEASLPAANKTVLYQLRASAECGGSSLGDLKKIAEAKNDAASWAAYGSAAVADGDYAAGVAAFDRAVKLAPNDARIRKSQVRALVQQAASARGSQDNTAIYAKAIAPAEQLVRAEENFDNQLLLGEVQLGAKQYEQALASFRRAAGMNASAWLPHYYAGSALTVLERYDQAIEPLNKALTLARSAEDQRKIFNQLGFIHEKQKNWAESIVNYEKAGNSRAIARVQQNQEIDKFNQEAEEHNKAIEELKREQEKLQEELEKLPGSGPPP